MGAARSSPFCFRSYYIPTFARTYHMVPTTFAFLALYQTHHTWFLAAYRHSFLLAIVRSLRRSTRRYHLPLRFLYQRILPAKVPPHLLLPPYAVLY